MTNKQPGCVYSAFLPAALEIQQRPPHPLARWLGFSLIGFCVIGLLWACIGKVDVVSVAEGKIIPSSRVKQIQPLEKGVVQAIHVVEGQHVKAGDALVTLDRTSTGSERERRANELSVAQQNLARDNAFLKKMEAASDVVQLDNTTQQALLEQQWQHYQAQRAGLVSQHDNRVAEQQVNEEVIRKLQGTLPIVTRRAHDLQKLTVKKLVAENQYLEAEEARITQKQDLAAAMARRTQLAAAVAESAQQQLALSAQTRADTLSKLTEGERQVSSLQAQLTQAQDFDARQVLYAPVDGVVKELAINTVGGVVLEAQQLMLVVPEESHLEVEAFLPNKDIGFVEAGQTAQVKIHTFPFTKYGTIPATVARISGDAVSPEKKQADQQPASADLAFSMSLMLERNTLSVDGKSVKLVPGMQVTAEVITHQRRLIEYFLSPLQQRAQESVRER
jgi:hemolysin D